MTFSFFFFWIQKKILRARDPTMLPSHSFIFFGTLSAMLWICYGVVIRDLNMIIPNVVGSLAGGLQMYLSMYLQKDTPLFEFTI